MKLESPIVQFPSSPQCIAMAAPTGSSHARPGCNLQSAKPQSGVLLHHRCHHDNRMLFAKNCNLLTCSHLLWKENSCQLSGAHRRGNLTQEVENCLPLRDYRPVFHRTDHQGPFQKSRKQDRAVWFSTQRGERQVGFPLTQKGRGNSRMTPVEL